MTVPHPGAAGGDDGSAMAEPTLSPAVEVVPSRAVRFQVNCFEALIALLCLISALSFYVDPHSLDDQAVGTVIPIGWAWCWTTGLALAGAGILAGIWTGRANVESAGLILLSSAVAIQATAVIAYRGPSAIISTLLAAAVVISSLVRVRILLAHKRAIIVSLAPEQPITIE